MCGSNPRISAWSSADPMCPSACTFTPLQIALTGVGLTGYLISTIQRVSRVRCPWYAML